MWADQAFDKLINEYEFQTVMDIGCGQGEHTELFISKGKDVISVDLGVSIYFKKNQDKYRKSMLIGDFNKMEVLIPFDCVWASHVLEHQRNVGLFLDNIYKACRDNGIVAITVPPAHPQVLGGHLTLWNAGLLLYNMVLAGFDCSQARLCTYGFNISLIVRKVPADLPSLDYDNGDVERISRFLPIGLHEGFDGNIKELNWRK